MPELSRLYIKITLDNLIIMTKYIEYIDKEFIPYIIL